MWTPEAQHAFNQLKAAMASICFGTTRFSGKMFVIEDVFATGITVVLFQGGHPLAYYSKTLGVPNQRLSIYEKEFSAVKSLLFQTRAQ